LELKLLPATRQKKQICSTFWPFLVSSCTLGRRNLCKEAPEKAKGASKRERFDQEKLNVSRVPHNATLLLLSA